MAVGVLPEAEEGNGSGAGMSDIEAVDGAVVLDQRLHGGFPEDAVASGGLDSEEVGVGELHKEACSLAEVAPYGVPHNLHVFAASCS